MYPKSLQELIEHFRRLPGVGEKTAERYALSVTDMEELDVREFARALVNIKEKLTRCRICGNLSEAEECAICSDNSRNKKLIFVVQSAKDVLAMEKTNEYRGVYHVLNGLISSSKGKMPEDLNIDDLWGNYRHVPQQTAEGTVSGSSRDAYRTRTSVRRNAGLCR